MQITAMLVDGLLFQLMGFFVLLEVGVLSLYWIVFKRGVSPKKLIANVAAGSCLMTALWVSLSPGSNNFGANSIVLLLVLLSLLFHVVDLLSRWQSKSQT